jgi:uncharacterized protein (DUF2141 family)
MKNRKPHPLFVSMWPLMLMLAGILFAFPSVNGTMPGPSPDSFSICGLPHDEHAGGFTAVYIQPHDEHAGGFAAARIQPDNEPVVLEVVAGEFRRIRGDLFIEVSDSSGEVIDRGVHPVSGRTVTVHFDSLTPGTVAVRLFHDENSDGKLNTNFLGIPREGYGFSNNPGSRFGEPPLEDRLFALRADTTIRVELIYW